MNERVKWQRVTDSSGACVTRRRPAVHGTGRAPQPRRAGISTVFDTRTGTDARGTGPPAGQQPREECLRYAHENGCPWDENTTCMYAAEGEKCLRYAHENGCPWDVYTCASAAGEGIWSACDMHMRMDARGTCTPAGQQLGEGIWSACDMRMRMDARGTGPPARQQPGEGIHSPWDGARDLEHENGCPWDGLRYARAPESAAGGGHLECLRYGEWMPVGRTPAGQQPGEEHLRMDARGAGPPARQQPGEGIWSACDMHMRMDARGTGPPACQQPGEGIWSVRYARDNGCPCLESCRYL